VTVSKHQFVLVSKWMENGNINDFIKRDQQINRTKLVCYSFDPMIALLIHCSVG